MSESGDNNVLNTVKLEDFTLKSILINNASKKLVFLLGTFTNSETDLGIVIIEKVEFTETSLTTQDAAESILKHIQLKTPVINDVYGNYSGDTDAKFNQLKVSIIYPATEKHINKYSAQEFFLIEETPEMYSNVTLPFLMNEQFTLDWVYNILEHKQEADRIIYEDLDPTDGFMLLPDYKWNGQIESLYVQAIVMNRNIKSIRDLNATHLKMLKNIKTKGLENIKSKYGLKEDQVRAYFHYQPSFYHLHVHFTSLKYDAPGIVCEKSHLLNSVINNIELMPDYYQKSTLSFTVGEKSNLYKAIKKSQSTADN